MTWRAFLLELPVHLIGLLQWLWKSKLLGIQHPRPHHKGATSIQTWVAVTLPAAVAKAGHHPSVGAGASCVNWVLGQWHLRGYLWLATGPLAAVPAWVTLILQAMISLSQWLKHSGCQSDLEQWHLEGWDMLYNIHFMLCTAFVMYQSNTAYITSYIICTQICYITVTIKNVIYINYN